MGENEGAGPPWGNKKRPLSGRAIDLGRNHAEGTVRAHVQEGGWAIRATERKPRKLDQCQRDKVLPDRDEGISWGQITEGLVGREKQFESH